MSIVKLDKEVSCPDCHSSKVVKNGKKKTGAHNLLCRSCGLQFQGAYVYWGAVKSNKVLLLRMLLRGSGVRDCCAILGISMGCVWRTLLNRAAPMEIKPKHRYYNKVQIDEQWSYVGRKKKKVWMLYAICAESGEILAASWGRRNKKNVKMLLLKMKALEINFYCTDSWRAFMEVLPAQKHIIGKCFTKKIEGFNTWFRTRLRRLMRRTTGFSKKLHYHYAMMKAAICHRNLNASYI